LKARKVNTFHFLENKEEIYRVAQLMIKQYHRQKRVGRPLRISNLKARKKFSASFAEDTYLFSSNAPGKCS
jgi:hypothetical protein